MDYADDLQVGTRYDLGRYHVTTGEMVDFARHWDPQPFHIDPEAAAHSAFGELIGSGLHSLAILQRLTVDGVFNRWAVLAGRRLRGVELTRPLTGGLVLDGTVEIEAISPQPARNRALVTTRGQLHTAGALVLEAVFETYVHLKTDQQRSLRNR